MGISYFDDLEFVGHGETPHVTCMQYRKSFKDYWGVQCVRSGRYMLKIGDREPEYSEDGAIFLTFPGIPFLYGPTRDFAKNHVFVCFRGRRVERYLASGLLQERQQNALLHLADPERFLNRMRNLRAFLSLPQQSGENHARAAQLLENLLLDMSSPLQKSKKGGDWRYPAFSELVNRLVVHPEADWDFEQEAQRLAVSYPHFRRLFEQYFHIPPGSFLLEARLNKAASLLTNSKMPVRAIAEACGFQDEFYFSRIFKKYRSVSPKLFRKKSDLAAVSDVE